MTSSIFNFKRVPALLRRSRMPKGLLAALAGIALIELLVSLQPRPACKDLVRHRFYSPNVTPGTAESVVQWQVANITFLEEKQELLLLGGSACLNNLDAELLMEKTGLKTWNLGTFGFFYTDGHADILQFFIEHRGPPRFLVYHTSQEAVSASRSKKEIRSWLRRLREWIVPPEPGNYPIPSLRYRRELRNRIFALGKNRVSYTGLDQPRENFGSDREIRQILRERRGTGAGLRTHGSPERKGFPDRIFWDPRFDPACVEGLERIFAIAREHDFPVLVQFNPLPEQADNEMVRKAMEEMEENLGRIAAPHPRVTLYRPFLRFYPDDHCADLRHLTEKGRRRQTGELIDWIRRHWLAPSKS
ncbi:MAG: hypothetical protein U9N73_04935 [Candidatus Auribacterota bacterium]|nr:hypothetical protein [Candidatus Auribacterota bacterium]